MSLMVHPFRSFLVYLSFAAFLCASPSCRAQNLVVYDNLEQLQSRINQAGDTTLVINFWATWCTSCVEELPSFDQLRANYSNQDVQIVLVSLDFKNDVEKKLIPFLKKHPLKPDVAVMADQDLNAWIPFIYDDWDGAIPATLVFKGKNRQFNLGKFENYEELDAFVRPFVPDSAAVFINPTTPGNGISEGKK